ncbi:hypothetical protein BV898_18497 [Hypsibius exemplaris]|uniref:Uncharacterized protein n=1 Tax=Hypsibius exemplaris TaxID=2072580 RepID=A0A9X6RN68_HYPEX|nr:hypothetical protein BV898_18497 [Hypsibius exemplaris]
MVFGDSVVRRLIAKLTATRNAKAVLVLHAGANEVTQFVKDHNWHPTPDQTSAFARKVVEDLATCFMSLGGTVRK